MSDPTAIEKLKTYCAGRELEQTPAGAVARFFRDCHVTRFATLEDLRTAACQYGPNTTQAEISAAIAAAGI